MINLIELGKFYQPPPPKIALVMLILLLVFVWPSCVHAAGASSLPTGSKVDRGNPAACYGTLAHSSVLFISSNVWTSVEVLLNWALHQAVPLNP